ncbi:MAG TPA: arginine--tRNA ligase, partial [Candidatus Dojkabacteria bacterium]|nr:arginine--tRNA ligase [Candidatus Dojkabacteria bacterium]
ENKIKGVDKVEPAGPGFINISLDQNSYKEILKTFDEHFGSSNVGQNKKIMIEFGQPNTHKALQLGHFKSAVTGLALSRMYANIGYNVIKANYFGDIGKHTACCMWGILKHFDVKYTELDEKKSEKIIEKIKKIYEKDGVDEVAMFLDKSYVTGRKAIKDDEEIAKEIAEINAKIYDSSDENLLKIYKYTRDLSIEHQDKAFKQLDVVFDRQYPESEIWKTGRDIVLNNTKSETNPNGIFVKDQNAIIFPGKDYGLRTWVFLTSQGYPTYSGKDLGLAITKFKEHPDLELSIITTSVEQVEYFKGVIKAFELLNPQYTGKYTHVGFGWLLYEGKKMSSKTGKNVKYSDLIPEAKAIAKKKISDLKKYDENEIDNIAEKIAIGGIKFAILSHELHKDINYNPESFLSFAGLSAPYVTYAYARANGILNNAKYSELKFEGDLKEVLNEKEEMNLLKKINEFPNVAKNSGVNRTPHVICNYIFELSELFNQFYNSQNVLDEADAQKKESRLALVYITKEILKKGLYLLGIETVERM